MNSPGRVLAIANPKGGVSKTTTTANLAAALAERDRRVLAVDLDPQASLTLCLGLSPKQLTKTIYDALTSSANVVDSLVLHTSEHFDLVPANSELRSAEPRLENGRVRIFALRDALAPIRTRYDYILIDCPANGGILTGNALAAANEVIIPFPPDYLALQALDWFVGIIQEVKLRANPNLRVAGFLLSMYDPRTRHARQIVAEVNRQYGEEIPFFSSAIHLSTRLREAACAGKTILRYASNTQAATAFRDLALEIEEGIRKAEPQDAQACVRAGREALAEGDMSSAYATFSRATQFEADLASAWIGRARTAPDSNDSLRCWARALQIDSSDKDARAELDARLRERLAKSAGADIPDLVPLGHYFNEVGQREYAELLFQHVTELDPSHEQAWLGWARAAGDSQTAFQRCAQVLRINPRNSQAQGELASAKERVCSDASRLVDDARALAQSGEVKRAHEMFSKAAEMDPQNDRAWVGCARTSPDPREALGFAEKALKLNPQNAEAKDLYHWLWVPTKESWQLPIPIPTLISIMLALLILGGAIYFLVQGLIR